MDTKEKNISNFILLLVFCVVIFYFIFLQFLAPVLYGIDGYYHVAVSNFIKEFGPRYEFRWAQFSTFKDSYADKDFLFHLLIIPFLYLSDNIVLAGKYAVIFFNILFILIYIFILKKYLPNFLVSLFLLLPIFSSIFSIYSLYLRPAILANILTILAIYFLINKKGIKLFIISLLYPLGHISFLMLIIFAFICEIIRYFFKKEFFQRNIYIVIIGILIGCLIHPNFPKNFLSIYLNFFLVPFYSITGLGIPILAMDFAGEFYTLLSQKVFLYNFLIFFTLNIILFTMFLKSIRVSLSTFVWWGCTSIYLTLSFTGNRYWYTTNILFFIFFASFLRDWLGQREWKQVLFKINTFVIIYAIVVFVFIPTNIKSLCKTIESFMVTNMYYENTANWMQKHIPSGETIYHAYWDVSSVFICLNPKNNYFVVLDPIYMYHKDPKKYVYYTSLHLGVLDNPHIVLKEMFKVKYGYNRKNKLYYQIKNDSKHFRILYEDNLGIVFEVIR